MTTTRADRGDAPSRPLPWKQALAWLPLPTVVQVVFGQLQIGHGSGPAALTSVLLTLPLILWFTVRSWQGTTGPVRTRAWHVCVDAIGWNLGLAALFVLSTLATVPFAGTGSVLVEVYAAVVMALIAWPFVMMILLFFGVCGGGCVMLLRKAWLLRGTEGTLLLRYRLSAGAAALLGGMLLVVARMIDLDGQLGSSRRDALGDVVRSWYASGPVGVVASLGGLLFAGGVVALLISVLPLRRR